MLEKLKQIKKPKKEAKSSSNERLIVALDIGTEFIKALVTRIDEDNQLEILGVGRAHQSLTDMQAGAIADIAAVVANCDSALNQAEQLAGVSARSAVIGIAGELVKGNTTTVRFTRKDPNKQIDIAEVDHIFSLVQERALNTAKKQLAADTGGKEIGLKLVNSALIAIEIDGYGVTNPIGFQGKDVQVQLYTAFAPQVHIGAIERVAEQLDLDLLTVAAEPFAVARSVIGDDPNANLSAILIDVGGGTTDIAVVNEGGVEGTKMFGIGGRSFTKSVERDLNVDFERAEALKLGLSNGRTPDPRREPVEDALHKTLSVWMSGIELALEEFKRLDHLPHKVLLCGGGASLEMLTNTLAEDDWYTDLPFTRKPEIQLINPNQVVGITDKTGVIDDHTFITAMGLLRVGIDTLLQYDAPGTSIRDRLNKMLKT
ncbi:MAG TPA: cell division FtsA domain-containing protein [Patescibacteria group bacterium]|nr:cell division FtsA domain-containing protein [Patescibacteria group bacterium]